MPLKQGHDRGDSGNDIILLHGFYISRIVFKKHQNNISISKPLTFINHCFITDLIPHQWNTSDVSLIFKTGKTLLMNNYRPMSVIRDVLKVFQQ